MYTYGTGHILQYEVIKNKLGILQILLITVEVVDSEQESKFFSSVRANEKDERVNKLATVERP